MLDTTAADAMSRPEGPPSHPLKAWLAANGISQTAFADRIGLCRTTLNKILNGCPLSKKPRSRKRKRHPPRFSLEMARRVVEATEHAVTLEVCLYFWTDNPRDVRPCRG